MRASFAAALGSRLRYGGAAPIPPAAASSAPDAPVPETITGAAGSFTLDWSAPLYNADGSTLSALTTYTVYWGATQGEQHAEGAFTSSVAVAANLLTKTQAVAAGTWWVGVSATNASGESNVSSELQVVVT